MVRTGPPAFGTGAFEVYPTNDFFDRYAVYTPNGFLLCFTVTLRGAQRAITRNQATVGRDVPPQRRDVGRSVHSEPPSGGLTPPNGR
jgi:hypothetical protein